MKKSNNYQTTSSQLKNYRLKKFYYYEYDAREQLFGKLNKKGWLLRSLIVGSNIIFAVCFIGILPNFSQFLTQLITINVVEKVNFFKAMSYLFTPLFYFFVYFLFFLPALITVLAIIPILLMRTIRNVQIWSLIYFFAAIFGFLLMIGLEVITIYFLSSKLVEILILIMLVLLFLLIILPILLYVSSYKYQLYLERMVSKEIHK